MDRQTHIQTDKQTYGQTNKHKERQTNVKGQSFELNARHADENYTLN